MHTTPDASPPTDLAPLAPADAPFETPPLSTKPALVQCANCGVELLGPHCYACGQPVKGMVRHLSSILADAADTILNIDSRIFRTLWPLFLRPGYLTTEYFAGRRVRYVTPFRLYFFLSVATFFLMQFEVSDISSDALQMHMDATEKIASSLTAAEVTTQRDIAIADLEKAKSAPDVSSTDNRKLEKNIEKIRSAADHRLEYLKHVDEAKAKGEPVPEDPEGAKHVISIGNSVWNPKTRPIHIAWLPQVVSDKVNQLAMRAQENVAKMNSSGDFKPLLLGSIGVLPQVLFVLMPLFAFMLKIFYIFKRRLYMEHLIVALHSHAFIFLALFLLTLTGMARGWAATETPWLVAPLGWVLFALGWWLPIYLFLMQKKVYKQGWILTTLKYSVIGICYTVMITLGAMIALVVGLATT